MITEFTDAHWEANGLLDPMRGPKVYHDRLARLNASDVVVADMSRRDVCSREPLQGLVGAPHELVEGLVAAVLALSGVVVALRAIHHDAEHGAAGRRGAASPRPPRARGSRARRCPRP